MDCVQAREALSAQLDGEPLGMSERLIEAHVDRCPACQLWREAAFEVTRRVRVTGWVPGEDRTEDIVERISGRRRLRLGRRMRAVLLLFAGLGQFLLTVSLLSERASHALGMDLHDIHELATFDFALGVAFVVGAIRPRLAGGMAWPCCAAAFGLVATALVDVVGHRTFEMHELRHLIALVGAALLCLTARDERRREPDDLRAAALKRRLRQDAAAGDGAATARRVAGGGAA